MDEVNGTAAAERCSALELVLDSSRPESCEKFLTSGKNSISPKQIGDRFVP